MIERKRRCLASILFIVSIVMFSGWVGEVQSQRKYPTKPIDMIVAYPAGGGGDLFTRIMAHYMNKKWGVPVNVINKPGAGGITGTLEVYNARPDGYTMLGDNIASSSFLYPLGGTLPFEIMDRTFINCGAIIPVIFVVSSESPYKILKDVIAEAERDPGNFSWTAIPGSTDLASRQFFKAIGVDIKKTKPVVCKGGGDAIPIIAGNHVKLGCGSSSTCMPSIKGGQVRALAITTKNRWDDLPDLPTTAELGYPTVNGAGWYGPSGPPKLPSYIVEIWDKAMQEFVKDPEVIGKLRNIGAVPYYLNSHDIREYVRKENEVVKELWGIK